MNSTPAPRPPSGTSHAPREASAGRRVLAVLLAIILAFAAAVMIAVMVDVGDRPRCDDTAAIQRLSQTHQGLVKCFDVTTAQRTVTLVLGWVGGVLAGIAALLALAFAVTGARGGLVLLLTALAVALSGLSILIGSI